MTTDRGVIANGPPGLPLVGSLLDLREDRLSLFLDAAMKYGDVVRFSFGPSRALVLHLLRHPDHIKRVFVDCADRYSKRTPGVREASLLLGNGLLTSEGEFWLRQRRLIQPAFHRQRIHAFGEVMVRAGDELVDAWLRRPRPDAPIDVTREMMMVALRVVTETLLGTDQPVDAALVGEAFDVILDDIRGRLATIVPIPRSVPTRRNVRFNAAVAALNREVSRIIVARRKNGGGRDDLLSMLMAARDAETGASMTDEQLRDEVMTIFAAGHETTANALAWTFLSLSNHPEVRRRMRAEIDEVCGARLPTVADLPRLDFTSRVFQESMRLHPPAWAISRRAEQDDVIGGYVIPKDSLVLLSPYVTHRHPAFWENPEAFDPDRFANDALSKLPRFAYFPFGGGARLCIGSTFAMVEGTLLLATISRRVRLDWVPGQKIVPEPGITLRPGGGTEMRVVAG